MCRFSLFIVYSELELLEVLETLRKKATCRLILVDAVVGTGNTLNFYRC